MDIESRSMGTEQLVTLEYDSMNHLDKISGWKKITHVIAWRGLRHNYNANNDESNFYETLTSLQNEFLIKVFCRRLHTQLKIKLHNYDGKKF